MAYFSVARWRPALTTAALFAGLGQAVAMLPEDWATEKQKAAASKMTQAVASTEVCDLDVDPERLAEVIRVNFGDKQSSVTTADLLYMVVVAKAGQGVMTRRSEDKKDWCDRIIKAYGPGGTEIKGLLVP